MLPFVFHSRESFIRYFKVTIFWLLYQNETNLKNFPMIKIFFSFSCKKKIVVLYSNITRPIKDWNEMKSGYKKGERKFQSFEWVTITTNQSQCASTRMSTRHIPCLFPVKFIFPHNFHAQRPVSLKLYMKKWQRNANRTRNQTGEEKKYFRMAL